MLPKFNISCSTIKAYHEVDYGNMCGLFFKAMHIDKTISIEATPSMKLGQYAEYRMTGSLPRDGKAPQPVTVKNGDLNTQYQRVENQVTLFKDYLKRNKIEDITVGRVVEFEFEGYNIKGIFDFDYGDENIFNIEDIKTSGFIDNKWEAFGWEDVEKKPFLTIQAIAYVWLAHKKLNRPLEQIKFRFYIIDNNHYYNRKILDMIVTQENLDWFEAQIRFTTQSIEHNEILGWASTLNYKHCAECPLRANCDRRIYHPIPKQIFI